MSVSVSSSSSSNHFNGYVGLGEEAERGKMIDYEPLPYTFRIPDKLNKIGETPILSPPQWLLLDHTIAVIWSLFTTFAPGKALDIDDLKWAREFLKDIRNVKGDHPPDVKTCLNEIENRLIALYAQLTHGKVKAAASAEENIGEQTDRSAEPKERETPEKTVVKTPAKDASPGRRQLKIPAVKEIRKSYNAQQKNMNGIPKKYLPTNKKSEIPRRENKKEEGNFFREVFQRNKANDRILGMQSNINKKNVKGERGSNRDIPDGEAKIPKDSQIPVDDPKISLEFKKWVSNEEINNEQAYRNLKDEIRDLVRNPRMSKEKILNFLTNWREEQVGRFQSELKRLNSIEKFMKSIKMEGFVPYLPEDLTVKLESVACKKKKSKPS